MFDFTEYMAEREVQAGQEMRLVSIDVSRKHGAHDALHGKPSGAALSAALIESAAEQ